MSVTFKDTKGRRVIAVNTATKIGKVKGFVVDPTASRVSAVQIGGRGGKADVVDWEQIDAFGDDAVMVVDDQAPHRPDDRQKKALGGDLQLLDHRVLDDAGFEHGKVTDATFDPATGRLTGVLTADGVIDADRLLSIGSYALVIRAAD